MSLVAWIKGRGGANGFGYASTAEEVTAGLDLTGKTYLITGVGSGLGAESARVLAARGARIVGSARTMAKAEAACASLPDAVPVACELGDPASVRACVAQVRDAVPALNAIVANAGVMMIPEREQIHGVEKQLFVNHVGHFMLITGLLDHLAEDGRVVMVSSAAHHWAPEGGIRLNDLGYEAGYQPRAAYGQSKLANLLFARELGRRFVGSKRTANALHPGVIHTELGRHLPGIVRVLYPLASAIAMKSAAQGAATQCYLTAHPAAAHVSGEYYADCNRTKSSRRGRDMELAARLWEATEGVVAGL